eukprot:NODE_474_length_7000_cov_1.160122.p3 type:complete len:286 gc:universal NODE_474_length_7000_cov_1.160122:539-1396(+)
MAFASLLYGIGAAVFSSLLTGSAFVMQKNAIDLHYATKPKSKLIHSKYWWFAMMLNVLGESFNLIAYTFAPPTIITPLGVLSVVTSAILSDIWLKDSLSQHGKIACLLCVLGSITVVLHAPEARQIYSIEQFLDLALQTRFIIYFWILVLITAVCFYLNSKGPRVIPLITIASISASFSVCLVQAVAQGIFSFLSKKNDFNFLLLLFTGITICTLIISLYFFNVALSHHSASRVTPIYYVLFTFYTLLTSSLLWGFETNIVSAATIVLSFMMLACGVFILQKDSL